MIVTLRTYLAFLGKSTNFIEEVSGAEPSGLYEGWTKCCVCLLRS